MKQPMPGSGAPPKKTGSFGKSNSTKAGGQPLPIAGHNKNQKHPSASKSGMKDSQKGAC